MSLVSVHCYTAGDDSRAASHDPRRFLYSLNANYGAGWSHIGSFKAYTAPIPGTTPVYVSEAGGKPADPHRCRVGLESGVPMNWTRDVVIFYAYLQPVPGTVPHYVMERGGGDPALGDPNRSEITANPNPMPGWSHKLTFFVYPETGASLQSIHVYTAGADERAPQGDPRRFLITLDPSGPLSAGWAKAFEFKAYTQPLPGTVQIFVSEAGGRPGDPHRCRVGFESGVPMNWTRDLVIFYAHSNPVPGAVQFFVMERGGGDPALGDPNRSEITRNPNPMPGWFCKLSFYAFA